MELNNDVKFALDCAANSKFRRPDAIRSAILQLQANRDKVDYNVFKHRRSALMGELSKEVDKEDGSNSYIALAKHIAKDSPREVAQDKWTSLYAKRLQEGMSAGDIITSLNPKLKPMVELAQKYKEFNKKRLINLEESENTDLSNFNFDEDWDDAEFSDVDSSFESIIDDSIKDSPPSTSNKIVEMFQQKMKPPAPPSSPIRSKLTFNGKGSPTRVSGIFKKKNNAQFKPPRILSNSTQQNSHNNDNQPQYNFNNAEVQNTWSHDEMADEDNEPEVDHVLESSKKKFMTGLDVHLFNEVKNKNLAPDEARKISEDSRKNARSFNNPTKKPCKSNDDNKENNLLKDDRLKGIDKSMIELIKSEIIFNLEGVDWTKVAGLDKAKTKIKEVAILPLLRPDLFTGIRTPPKGILLFGPPGTGKTMIGKCIASQAKATFFSITSSTLTSKWVGNSEKTMKTLFAVARCLSPSVIFIDEVDSLLKSRSDSEHESERRMKTEFLSQFDGLSNNSNDGLLVIGTTNRPQELDDAVRRRFSARLYISMPEKAARKNMIENNLEHENHVLTSEEMDIIAERTEGYSGSDIKSLCGDAAMHPFKDVMDRLIDIDKKDIRPICCNDFLLSLNTVKPSFSMDDLKQYDEWNNKYGSC